jgi:hypothetical protein
MNATARWVALTTIALGLSAGAASADPIAWGRTRSAEPSEQHDSTLAPGAVSDVNHIAIDDSTTFGSLSETMRTRPVSEPVVAETSRAWGRVRHGASYPVPEPASALLMVVGCVLLAKRSRRS